MSNSDRTGDELTVAASTRRVRARAPVVPGTLLESVILQILAQSDIPLGAYYLADAVRDRSFKVPMMSIYRALDRLVAEERIQKVAILSAYRIRDKAKAILMVCGLCGRTQSVDVSPHHDALLAVMADHDFSASSVQLEAFGQCGTCRTVPIQRNEMRLPDQKN